MTVRTPFELTVARLTRVIVLSGVVLILAFYGRWMSAIGIVVGGIGFAMMYSYGRSEAFRLEMRSPYVGAGFFLGAAIGVVGLILFVWGMF